MSYVPTMDELRAESTEIGSCIKTYMTEMEKSAKYTIGNASSDAKASALNRVKENRHIRRAIVLANAKRSGEDQFLTGINVLFNLTISLKSWVQFQRYHFLDFVSSFSLMHCATRLDLGGMTNSYVTEDAVRNIERLLREHAEAVANEEPPEIITEKELAVLYNAPTGLELTAGMTTNYRCLKNMYRQRRKDHEHKLPDWHVFNDWIETLPMSGVLITGKDM